MNIVKHKYIYFLISLIVIIPGTISLFVFGLTKSIDFTGGSRLTFILSQQSNQSTTNEMRKIFSEEKEQIVTLQTSGTQVIIRTNTKSPTAGWFWNPTK